MLGFGRPESYNSSLFPPAHEHYEFFPRAAQILVRVLPRSADRRLSLSMLRLVRTMSKLQAARLG